jgi:predicted carbohydrate-binding protein with CBM5 and CBM33 domain
MDSAKPFARRDNKSGMNREGHVQLCVQERLVCSAGDSPAKGTANTLVARWQGEEKSMT